MKAPLAREIFEPDTVDEAVRLLAEKGNNAVVVAGGTDVLIKLKSKVLKVESLIDIYKLPLNYIKGSSGDGFQIGATTTARQLARSELIKRELPVLAEAALHLGGPQTQELATIGGNIGNASPSANLVNVLMALEASVNVTGPGGNRTIPMDKFFTGPGASVLGKNELLTGVIIPPLPAGCGTSYLKYALRREMDIAVVGVAVKLVPKGDSVASARIALASVGPVVFLAEKAQAILAGQKYSAELVEKAAAAAEAEGSYITDVRASAAYRKKVTWVIVKRAIEKAWSQGKGA